nr:pyridoxamine 5'-phosphate oxidase family protein [Janthinobacterium sp. Marseille]
MNIQPELFHAGELQAQALAGTGTPPAAIRNFMPDQHREFFALLPYTLLASTDEQGWPIATVVTGQRGFLSSPDAGHLQIAADAHWQSESRQHFVPGKKIGMLGIDFSTRRRNRANGIVQDVDDAGLHIQVSQSFGNCPRYIQLRDVNEVHKGGAIPATRKFTDLDATARALISKADTLFIATTSDAHENDRGGPDISHRGGMPGFVRIDGNTLTVPDFNGNRYFNTLGNMVQEPRAALLFIDFASGTLLHLQGRTEILWQSAEAVALTGAERLWRFHIENGWYKSNAIPLRWTLREIAPTTARTGVWAEAHG